MASAFSSIHDQGLRRGAEEGDHLCEMCAGFICPLRLYSRREEVTIFQKVPHLISFELYDQPHTCEDNGDQGKASVR